MVLAPVLAALAFPGCYERTVSTKGLGTDTRAVEEPYAEDWPFSAIDREIESENRRRAEGRRQKEGGGWE